jgi:hypothetical protein
VADVTHIRHKALARLRQTRDTHGQFDADPQRKTLCGASPTIHDLGWGDMRAPHSPAMQYVSCPDCRTLRFTKGDAS